MNPSRDFVRHTFAGCSAARASSALPRVPAAPLTRSGFPVVSNRAFVGAWLTRRNRLAAAAQVVRTN